MSKAPEKVWLDPTSVEPEFIGDDVLTGTSSYYVSTGDGIPDSVEYVRADLAPPACKHGVRWPHECRDCFAEAFPGRSTLTPALLERVRRMVRDYDDEGVYGGFYDVWCVKEAMPLLRDILEAHDG